ncbi:DUF6492 family protein [Aeromicrobium sp.]|uniref:DUF6492 family protein n=1 Tax=Aeromicrobium sp. TaxID=1871063 RepID=UPI0028AC537E|nr:DUF6492 family protein [Aeromicrobium sp.]
MSSAPTRPTRLTFVVVVFEAEQDLLRLQAASLARHLDPAIAARIVVLDQSRPPITGRARRRLLAAYGPLADRVDIVTTPPAADGWISQQVLKLTIADDIDTSHYVVLDAKTHAVGPVDLDTFFSPDGHAHLRWYRYDGHPMESRVARTAAWLGLPAEVVREELPATTTPFVFVTDEVRALVRHVEQREGATFDAAFRSAGLIEFPLYSLWLLRNGALEQLHDRDELRCPTVWAGSRGADDVRSVLAQVDREPVARFLAVHRSAFARLSPSASMALVRWWVDRGLFGSRMGALRFMVRARARIVVATVRSRVRSRVFASRG